MATRVVFARAGSQVGWLKQTVGKANWLGKGQTPSTPPESSSATCAGAFRCCSKPISYRQVPPTRLYLSRWVEGCAPSPSTHFTPSSPRLDAARPMSFGSIDPCGRMLTKTALLEKWTGGFHARRVNVMQPHLHGCLSKG